MITVAVLLDPEEGHLLASFWLSRWLKNYGYRVCYLGIPDTEESVRDQGFEFIPIWKDAFPRGSYKRQGKTEQEKKSFLGPLARGEVLDEAVAALRPDVMLVLSLYYSAGLAIYFRYKIPVVFFTPYLRHDSRVKSCESVMGDFLNGRPGVADLFELLIKARVQLGGFKDLVELVLKFPELVLLPGAFDLPERGNEPGVHYLGAGVDMKRKEESFAWARIDSTLPLIFCARGSQVLLQQESSQRFFQIVFEAAAARPGWQFIIATGAGFKTEDLSAVPRNVMLSPWVSQLEVLSRADLMINHGGFNTVKECILLGVPMVVLPLKDFRDHPVCAERVAYHGLGVQSDIAQVTSVELVALVDQVLNDRSFKLRVDSMREKFCQQDRPDLAARVIESVISNH
jgi:zeaxanthin glucosyltransferase